MKANSNLGARRWPSWAPAPTSFRAASCARACGGRPAEDRVLRRRQDRAGDALRSTPTSVLQRRVEPELDALEVAVAGRSARISVRVNPDVDAGTHANISTGKAENKFGVRSRGRASLSRAAKLPGVEVVGIDCISAARSPTFLAPLRACRSRRRRADGQSSTSISAAASASASADEKRRRYPAYARSCSGWGLGAR